ncbi:MAG: carbohydrate ABC transporter permease [Treponema sp.]|jgi:raffinose/stachyose/melibiose transport system permease protein|nr:carbohydrate ABC transporter permease [Treponema sp.]
MNIEKAVFMERKVMRKKQIHQQRIESGTSGVISRLIILIYCMLILYPLFFVIITSLKPTGEFYVNIWGLPKTWAFANYKTAWVTANIGSYMFNSVIIVGVVLIVTLAAGALAGYALSRFHLKYAEFIMMAILACTMLPSEAVLMPLYLVTGKTGITGTRLALIIPYIGWGLPMIIYIFRNFFDTIPGELLEAARLDGCGEVRTFVHVAVPIMAPAIATNAIFIFVAWWGELLWATVELASSSMKTIPIGMISFSAQFGTNWGPMCAAICIVLIPLVVFFCLVQKYFVKGLTGGAVKA